MVDKILGQQVDKVLQPFDSNKCPNKSISLGFNIWA